MFTSTVKWLEVELANKCNARCPQCPRYDLNLKLVPGLNKNEITLDSFKNIDHDVLQGLEILDLKGATGDPIIAKDLLPILNHVRSINETCKINLATNGSLHDDAYWQELAKYTQPGEITFGIDGLAGVHELYRLGTDFNTVIKNAQTFINAGGNARWQMLIFEHNEHQIETCEKLSKKMGFYIFTTMYSDRFSYVDSTEVVTKNNSYILKPTKGKYTEAKDKVRERSKVKKVSCMSMDKNSIFIYADGTVWPCCMLGGITTWGKSPHSMIESSMIRKHIGGQRSINDETLSDILQSDEWNNWAWVTEGHMPTCRLYCGVYN